MFVSMFRFVLFCWYVVAILEAVVEAVVEAIGA